VILVSESSSSHEIGPNSFPPPHNVVQTHLIFIPGAWHLTLVWQKVTLLLEEQGYKCIPITLPSTTGDITKSWGDDSDAVVNDPNYNCTLSYLSTQTPTAHTRAGGIYRCGI
jgi:hypothetical protein